MNQVISKNPSVKKFHKSWVILDGPSSALGGEVGKGHLGTCLHVKTPHVPKIIKIKDRIERTSQKRTLDQCGQDCLTLRATENNKLSLESLTTPAARELTR